ncbi:hypothetical protein [Nonlabens xylanidelens]|uniref:hypothetical protein n=1 Tax=Nonlabens xylanidelens TaxID=191564 RepID=UPI0011AFF7F5|nr:hypothetical protein [Nonlabens xylanidelens]
MAEGYLCMDSGATSGDVKLSIRNNLSTCQGNDIRIDDVSFSSILNAGDLACLSQITMVMDVLMH